MENNFPQGLKFQLIFRYRRRLLKRFHVKHRETSFNLHLKRVSPRRASLENKKVTKRRFRVYATRETNHYSPEYQTSFSYSWVPKNPLKDPIQSRREHTDLWLSKRSHKIQILDRILLGIAYEPVAKSRGDNLSWAHAVKAASSTKGRASRISHAGSCRRRTASSIDEPDELLLPEVVPLFIFLKSIVKRASTIWWTGVPGIRPESGEAMQAWCCLYQHLSLGKESINMGSVEGRVSSLENLEPLLWSVVALPSDTNWEFLTKRRYSGHSWDATDGTSPMVCSIGVWSKLHNFKRRVNALENTAWAFISSPVVRLHEIFGEQEPKTSQMGINAPARCGTWDNHHLIRYIRLELLIILHSYRI